MRSTLVDLPLEQKAARAVSALMDAAEAVAEVAREGGFAAAPAVVQPALAMSVLRAADQAQAAATAAIAAVDSSGWLPDGQVSLGRWIEKAGGLRSREANGLLAGARSLAQDHPHVQDAWLTGDISGSMAATLRHGIDKALHRVPPADRAAKRAALQDAFLQHAGHVTPDRMAAVLQDYRARVDPDGARQAEIDAHDEQHLRFTPVGESVVVRGWLSNETYAQIRTALDQTVDAWHRDGEPPDDRPHRMPQRHPHRRPQAPPAPSPPARPRPRPDLHRRPRIRRPRHPPRARSPASP